MKTYLDEILRRHRELAATDDRSLDALVADARSLEPARGFRDSLTGERLSVISEIKRRSPVINWNPTFGPDLNIAVETSEWLQITLLYKTNKLH